MQNRKIALAAILLVLGCSALSPKTRAITPAPDGGYPGGNTAEGQNALFGLTTGGYNTAVGYFSLRTNTNNSFNTAVGAGALLANSADENTAIGTATLLTNTTGTNNTATGAFALFHNTTGGNNTALGTNALLGNTDGNENTAIGTGALSDIPESHRNVAVGVNTLVDRVGDSNVAIGYNAGFSPTLTQNSNNNIYIGYNVRGAADDNHACYIGNIWQSNAFDSPMPVFVTMGDKLGTNTSSRRFKQDIKPMAKASEALFALKPVAFRYKKDPARSMQFGLVAEDVENVSPELVVHDKEGKPYSVRYDQVNAMLLNEFLKEHRRVDNLKNDFHATVAEQQKQIAALIATVKEQTAQIEKMKADFEVSKHPSQIALNNH